MFKYLISIALICTSPLFLPVSEPACTEEENSMGWDQNTPLSTVLFSLGEEKPAHFVAPDENEIRKGKELFFEGRTTGPNGKKSAIISKFYKCNNCHNTQREDPELTITDPQARLDYAVANNLPFLQGTTLYGTVNKSSWYNDDYIKKYGDLVLKARNNLREATQICAQHCSQGRVLKKWEEDALMAYFGSIEYKMADLKLSKEEWDNLLKNGNNAAKQEELRKMIHSKYLSKSPATFTEPPKDREAGYPVAAKNAANGKEVFERSCLACHSPESKVSDSYFEDDKLTFNYLKQRMNSVMYDSYYDLIRHGTYASKGHRRYMPNYTAEKLSDQQVEDLRAYIEEKSK